MSTDQAQPGPATRPAGRPATRTDADLLARALGSLPRFRGLTPAIRPLAGGLTNRTYQVTAPGRRSAVIRLPSGAPSPVPIDRRADCHNTLSAAHAGVAPPPLLFDPGLGISAVEWMEGRTLTAPDLDDADTLTRVAAVCRRLHRGRRFTGDFDVFAVQRRYLDVVTRAGLPLPADYRSHAERTDLIRRALAVHPVRSVPCHNDLVAANIVDDGDRLWLIDFEYAGNNDPYFELGTLWSEAALEPDRLEHLVSAYLGAPLPARVARARLFAAMADYAWTLWAAIQQAVSDVGFDFSAWGRNKYDRAVAEFTGPDFARLLDEVRQPG